MGNDGLQSLNPGPCMSCSTRPPSSPARVDGVLLQILLTVDCTIVLQKPVAAPCRDNQTGAE